MQTIDPRRWPAGLGGRPPPRSDRGERTPSSVGPPTAATTPPALRGADLVVDASRGDAVGDERRGRPRRRRPPVRDRDDRLGPTSGTRSTRPLARPGASAVVAANFSLGVALFTRLVEAATEPVRRRRGASTRTSSSGTAGPRPTGRPAPRASSPGGSPTRHPAPRDRGRPRDRLDPRRRPAPGMHLVGFDAAGETVELRITARDRAAYAAGVARGRRLAAGRTAAPGHPPVRPRRGRPARPPRPAAAA